MFKFAIAAVVSGALALAAIPQQAQAGGKGVALGVGLGVGAALLMHSAHKQQQSRQRAAARHRAAARKRAAAKKRAAYAAKKKAAYAAKKKAAARQAAIAKKKKAAARHAATAKQQQLAQIEANEEALVSSIELPGKKPEAIENEVAEVDTDEDFETVASLDEQADLQPVAENNSTSGNLDCKRYIPSAGLTISVPCGQ